MILVKQNEIDNYWDEVKDLIQMALNVANEFTLFGIKSNLQCNKMSMGITDDKQFVMVFIIATYELQKAFNAFLAAGDFGSNREEIDKFMVDVAKNEGCDVISFTGRRGWKKYTKELGYKPISVQIQKWL